MIRTLIEVTGENPSDHEYKLKATLSQIGYEPKADGDSLRQMFDLIVGGLHRRDLDPRKVADEEREHRAKEWSGL